MAESFVPKTFKNHNQTVIEISGDADLTGYTPNSVVFQQDGQPAVNWTWTDFHIPQGQPTRATLKVTPSAKVDEKLEPVSGTLTITLSGGGKEEDSLTVGPEDVTVTP
jgi:hypothetical protein